jgi:Mg-chelatase subunit ChlD/tetratricopeptide (TPR) repeat protein
LDELGPRQSFTTTESRSPTLAKGSVASNNSNLQPKLDHIYNSPDELLFGAQAGGQAGGTTGTPRPALTPQTVDNLRPYLSTQNKSPNLNVESRVTQQADAGDTANRAGSFKHQFTRRELDPTVSLEQNELEAKDLESQKLAQAVKERDEANRPFDPKAEPLQPDAPAAVPATGKPAQTGGENNHPHRSPHRTFVVDDAQPALAAPAAPAVPAAAAAPLAPSPSAPPVAGLAGVFTVPQLQTATPGHHKKAKQPQGASAASSTASASSSATDSSKNTAISADAINALQFPSGVPGIPGVDVNQLPAPASGGQSPAVSFAAPRPAAKKADTAKSAETSEAAIAAGKAAMKDRDYEKAAVYFKRASDLSPDTGKKSSLRKEAVDQFSTASVKLATELITEGRYQQAQDTLETALGEDYDPHNKKAVTLLSHLQQPDYFNKKITPEFRQNVEQVKQWFVEAQGLYDTGRLDLAKQRCEKILELDPYNRAAREFEEKVAHAQDDYGIAGYNGSRAKQVADVDNAWAMPVRKFNVNESASATSDASSADTAKIRHKLETIVIPKIDLHEVTVREAIDFLKKKSVELDGSSPAGSRGANIVLKLGDVTGGKGKAGDSSDPANARITLSLNNVPMIEALKYVTGLANLKFKVEPHAVSVVPLIESTDVLVTKEWKVTPGLIPTASETGKTSSKDADAKAREAAKNWLITNGIQFNGTASATYNPKTGRLIVRDTPDQLDLVDQIVENGSAAKAKPKPETPAKAEPKTEPKPEAPAKPEAPSPLIPQPEVQTQDNAFSTFSLNVSDVAFKLAAASLEQGRMPDPSTVRSEEFINAFDYRDPEPAPGAPLAFIAERAHDPFAQNRDLLRFSVKTAAAGRQPGRPLNIVLLLDKSGSMERADRVNIVREALRVLTTQLQPTDTLSIVTFARTPHLWADGVAGNKVADLIAKVSDITPEGGTNLEAALDLAYDTAQRHFAVTSINRVVLFTDGAANLGDVNPEALTKKVEAKRKQGVALDCFGIGWEGYNDDLLEQLTRTGDGRYGFINTPDEAKENFAAQLAGALQVAASDVKVQVEFNPHRVTAYRQIGYAKHQLTKEQFRDNSVAAAQIGAAESGNALYVVAIDPQGEGDIATVRVRYRVPGTSDYREHEWVVSSMGITPSLLEASPALRLAGTAAAFSEMLAANPYAGDVSSDRLLALLDGVPAIYGADPRPQKLEWMIRQAKSLGGR